MPPAGSAIRGLFLFDDRPNSQRLIALRFARGSRDTGRSTSLPNFDAYEEAGMPDLNKTLHDRFVAAIVTAFGPGHAGVDPLIIPSTNPRFGDYQANVAMSLAKTLGAKPRDVATRIVEHLDLADLCETTEIVGPGFINLTLSTAFLDQQLADIAGRDWQDVIKVDAPQRIVVDYSGPNVAKEMHVGHLRSTVIGDAIARVLRPPGAQGRSGRTTSATGARSSACSSRTCSIRHRRRICVMQHLGIERPQQRSIKQAKARTVRRRPRLRRPRPRSAL